MVVPARWTGLLDEETGDLDAFLLTPTGMNGGLQWWAIRGSYGTDADPANIALAVSRDGKYTLIAINGSIRTVAGRMLTPVEVEMVEAFINRNREALVRHWVGETDSVMLLDELAPE